MRRIYEPAAYGPPERCFWVDTVPAQTWPRLDGDAEADVAILGGGFTGLSAALHLAQAGLDTIVLEAEAPGFGASGRNGGFCCLGGAMAPPTTLARRFGAEGLAEWRLAERMAIDTAADLLDTHAIDVDRHSEGETLLAHAPRAFAAMTEAAGALGASYGVTPEVLPPEALRQNGLGGAFHGALTLPIGFALNPRKYHAALARTAMAAGARLHAQSPVTALERRGRWCLRTPRGTVVTDRVILATNGYSSEDVPAWLRGRYLPVQSSVIVTRPLRREEQEEQGWTSAQMAYDSRTLLHYFRLMPDGRFLFGMRGGRRATARARAAISVRIRRDFNRLFPAWSGIEITHDWSGLVCLMPGLTPFVGAVPDHPGLFAGMGYHGNGVAMGTYAGRLLGDLVRGATPSVPYPAALRRPPGRFPLGRFRRALLAPAYWAADVFDL